MNSMLKTTINFNHNYNHCSMDPCLYQKANTEIQHGSKYTKCMPLPSANRIMNAFFLVMLSHQIARLTITK